MIKPGKLFDRVDLLNTFIVFALLFGPWAAGFFSPTAASRVTHEVALTTK